MELNNTTQYAIRILNYINSKEKHLLHSAKKIAEDLNINYKFLTAIMTKLAKEQFVKSIRGRDGGFQLMKEANEIMIIDIIYLFDSSFEKDACILGIDKCNAKEKCFMHDKWVKPKMKIFELFEGTTLEDVKGRGAKF